MHRFRDLLFCSCLVCLFLLLTPLHATDLTSAPLGTVDYSLTSTPLDISRGNLSCTSISLSSPEIIVEEEMMDYQTFQVFGLPGEPFVLEEDNPSVPMIARYYRIPNTGGVDLLITNSEFEVMENVDALPVKFTQRERFDQVRKSSVYQRDEWYPPAIAEMSEPMIMRDFRVVRVVLYPVQVNPVTRQARVYRDLSVDIVANGQPGANELTNPHRITKSWVPIYQNLISNLDEDALLQVTEHPGTYMIMAKPHNNMRQWVDSLATWKKRKGFDVIIDTTHTGSASSMVTAIQTAYANAPWDSPLEFVALMGDPDWAAAGVPSGGADYDHIFALANNSDDLEDIGVGRLSGANAAPHMATINAKIMGYEREPHMETSGGDPDTMWFHRGFYYAGIADLAASNWTGIQWCAQQFRDWTNVDCTYVANHNGVVNPTTICNYLNLGVAFFLWRGAYAGEWNDGLPGSCNATWRLPINHLVTCFANDYVGGEGDAEKMLISGTASAPKGAVASIGTSTGGTSLPQNLTVVGGLSYNMANLHVEHIGHVLNGAKLWLTLLWGPGSYQANNFTRWNNLMGDPGLSIWTDVPNVMSVAHPSTINIGTGRMILDVSDEDNGQPIEEALVCLWKGSETYERAVTDLNGHVEMPLNIATEGELLVTVTKRNHKPYLASVMCVPSAQTVGLTYYTVDDNAGNNDGIFNPGEMIDLPVYLQNFGTADVATGVSATLVSQNPRVTVINGSQTFANINPGDSALSAAPFRVLLSAQMQNEESALLVFTITTAAGQTFSDIEIECVAPDAQYETHNFTGAVNPGTTNNLRVTLHNGGALPLLGTMATLVSLSPFVQVDDGGGVYGDIQPNQNITNTADQFTLTSNTLTFRGHQAPMRLIVATSNGFVDTTQFIVSIGSAIATDPTGPDAYGYFAYDNSDVSYEMHPEFSYVDISAGLGTDLDINDIGEKTMISQLWSEVRDLPFAFTYYGETYNEITVCSNGWIAFGDQGFNDHFRNYPIPAIFAPENMVAPYWDDLKTDGSRGVWDYYDEANHRYIVQWKAQATWTATNLDFEVILYDEFFDPTFDGNGQILFQYNDATMGIDGHYEEPNGCTIGIQNARNTIGLQYAFLTTYMPGSATITDGRAILFSTNARMLFGAIEGTVTDAETSLPLPGVDVTIDGFSYHTLTDATGHFLLDDVLIGTYTVRVHKRAYNDATTANIVVELDSTETVNYAMLHPEYEMSRDTLYFTIPGDPVVTTFDIVNDGNGPLDYGMTITYGGDDSPEPWDWLDGINLTDSTGDFMMQGCEFVGDYWWVSGGSGEGGNNFFYKFDIHGVYAGAIPQPSTTAFGWFDLAYDGEYLYGSDSHVITGVDESGIPQTTINSPLNPSRAIAYDPASDHFWVADYGSDIYEISRDGTVIQQIANEGENELNITGLAWNELDDEGYHLYLFSQNGTGIQTRLSKMHPVSHDIQLITTLEGQPGDHAGGLAITPAWNSTLLVIAGVLQNSLGDRLGIYEVTFNTTWIDVTPMANTVPGGNTQEVTVTIDPDMLRANEYRVNLNIASVVLDTTYRLPVILYVLDTAPDDRDGSVPQEFALYQNYPNPFNPSTEIRFDLPQTIDVELRVYNTLGQLVSTLVNETQTAGSHVVRWNGTSDFGEAVATGLYIYEVRAGSFVQAKKMIFLR